LNAELRHVRVSGLAPTPLERDAIMLELSANGSATETGMPSDWVEISSRMTSGEATANLSANADGPRVVAGFAAPLLLPERKANAEGRIEAHWDERGIALEPVSLSISSADGGADAAPRRLRLAARGRFDRSRGELVLSRPLGAEEADAVVLSDDGVHVAGLGSAKGFKLDGGIGGSLDALAGWIHSAPERLRGRWSARASAQSGGEGLQLGARLDIAALAGGRAVVAKETGGPSGEKFSAAVRGLLTPGGRRLDVLELSFTSRYATLDASGRLDDLTSRPRADLSGTFAPNWDAINAWLAANVEPGAVVTGRPRRLRLQMGVGDDWRRTLSGEFGVALDGADVYGMKLGPTALVVRAREGKLNVDPIETTINEGRLHLEPELRTGDEHRAASIRLGPGSTLTDAQVNDEVSRRVLSFIAPVLNNATRVRGRVSATIREAVFPIGHDGGNGPAVDGSVEFQDVAFYPGTMLEDIFSLMRREDRPLMRLDEPIAMTIADRRVYQRGLALPIGNLSRIEFDGWVDFDRKVNLIASIPVLPTMLADRPLLHDIAGDARIRVPIRGTLSQPKVDKEAFNLAMKDLGRSLLERGVVRGASGLIQRMIEGRPLIGRPDGPLRMPRRRRAPQREKRDQRPGPGLEP
jgi:translocation and assembly module TamB